MISLSEALHYFYKNKQEISSERLIKMKIEIDEELELRAESPSLRDSLINEIKPEVLL